MPYTYLAIVVLVGIVARPAVAQSRSAFACLGLSMVESCLLGFMAAAALVPLDAEGASRAHAINTGIALYLTGSNVSVADLRPFGEHLQSQHVLLYVLVCTALSSAAALLGGHLAQALGTMP